MALLAVLAACGAPQSAPAPSSSATPSVAATSEPVYIETKGNGTQYPTIVEYVADGPGKRQRIAYELRARSSRGVVLGSQSVGTFEQPHITFHDRAGKTLVADSPQAKISQQDKSVFMSGGVHARSGDGSVLTCDSLRYDGRTEKLHGEGHVVLAAPNDLTLTGNYLEGDVRFDDIRVAQHPL